MKSHHVLIVGAGAAGWSAADTLARSGWPGPVTIADPQGPMNRTLVNKGVLTGLLTPEQITREAPAGAELVREEVSAIEDDGTVRFRSGGHIRPAAVLLASGSTPRHYSTEADMDRVGAVERLTPLHSIQDAERVRHLLPSSGGRVVILGAGLVGSETASLLTEAGADVTLVSRSPIPLRRELGPVVASALLDVHDARLRTRFGHPVSHVIAGSESVVIELEDGERLEAHAALVAHGTVARRPVLVGSREGSIAVDGRLRSGQRDVYAAGGVAAVRAGGASVRVDHWEDAAAQGAHAARSIIHDLLGGPDPGEYRFAASYSSRIHGSTLTAWGVAFPGGRWTQPIDGTVVAVGTHESHTTAVVGVDDAKSVRSIAAEIMAARQLNSAS
ncbi:FAD-dependent oxidoreductase [Agromyces sp. NPDC049794]|uniref:FAD-dependent oxidoreductase n=1 Tax=unclassified Agromyces TaxID=2639701 RepID=UPI0033C828CE